MSDLLHQLENNEAILLMYIAGELPDVERREVEQMLATDATLRSMYSELKSAWDASLEGIERVDASEAMVLSREAAARQVGRMVRQWHAGRMVAVKPAEVARKRGGVRMYIGMLSASAAVVLVGFLVWWGVMAEPVRVTMGGNEMAARESSARPISGRDTESVRDTLDAIGLAAIVPVDPMGFSADGLDDVERQASHLADLGKGSASTTDN